MYLIHQENAEYNAWMRLIYLIPAGLLIGALVGLYYQELEALWVLLGDAVFISVLFYFIFPRQYQIYDDKLRIVLGKPFRIDIRLEGIQEVKHTRGYKAHVYSGLRFATSSRYVIEIVKKKGMNYIISPQHGELFLQQLNQATKGRAAAR
jgi:hypothetical protein